MKIIHLSDIHIGKILASNRKKFKNIVRWIINNEDNHQAKVVVISGDIVDDGTKKQFRRVKRELDRLKEANYQVLVTPGNHDYGLSGIFQNKSALKYFRKYLNEGEHLPKIIRIKNVSFILLDSMLEEMKELDFPGAQGEIGSSQLTWLENSLKEEARKYPKNKIVVILHHHPFWPNCAHLLRDRDEFVNIIKSKVNFLLYGHEHREDRFKAEEKEYGIDFIFASGSTTKNMEVVVIDLNNNSKKGFTVE